MQENFEKIRQTIEPVLLEHDFNNIEEECNPEISGSCYAIFQNAQEQIRLTWDGREYWFLLQSISDLSNTNRLRSTDIWLQLFNPEQSEPETVDNIADHLKTALLDYLGSRHA